jgi:hypothetical protein
MPINRRKNICPICEFNNKNYKIYLNKNLKSNLLNEYSFSSRKVPEFMNFGLIQCSKCSLIYSLNIPEFEKIYISYRDSAFVDFQDEKDKEKLFIDALENMKITFIEQCKNEIKVFLLKILNNFALDHPELYMMETGWCSPPEFILPKNHVLEILECKTREEYIKLFQFRSNK